MSYLEILEDRCLLSFAIGDTDQSNANSPKTIDNLAIDTQSSISSIVGKGEPAYQASSGGANVHLANPANGFTAQFQAGALQVRIGSDTWGMSLEQLGYGATTKPVGTAETFVSGNRVDLNYGTTDEWYINGPRGLEQGFNVAPAPRSKAIGSITLVLAMTGDLTASLSAADNGLILSRPDGSMAMGYNGLTAYDSTGKMLPSSLELRADGQSQDLLIHVNTSTAVGSITVDPFVQGAEVSASDGAAYSDFGGSVAISGNTMVVGAAGGALLQNAQGEAYVFKALGSSWQQVAILKASDGAANDGFGSAVAIDGDTIVVGAKNASSSRTDQGEAYVFTGSGSNWIQTAELVASDGAANDHFGSSVAIDDGRIVVGAPSATSTQPGLFPIPGAGAAYIFTGSGSSWSPPDKLSDPLGVSNDQFGASVAVSDSAIIVGAPNTTIGGDQARGAAYAYGGSPVNWALPPQLVASDGAANDDFGSSISLSGGTLVFGTNRTTAYVFTGSSYSWSQTARLTASAVPSSPFFANTVAVSGGTIVMQGISTSVGANSFVDTNGTAYVFEGAGSSWSQTDALTSTFLTQNDAFGGALAISGSTIVVGAPQALIDNKQQQGAAYVFEISPLVSGIGPVTGPGAGGSTVSITGAGFTGSSEVDFGSTPATSFVVDSDTQITAISPAGTGTVDVTVIKPGTASPSALVDQFTYKPAPTVTGLNLTSGPATGGEAVTITGTGFTGTTEVDFGGIPATYVVVDSDTQITATSPRGVAGPENLTVITPGGASADTMASAFNDLALPTVSGVSPGSGLSTGGTSVTIVGTGFTTPALVLFGTVPATNVVIDSAGQITANSPAGVTGTVDVTVIDPGGASPTSLADQFTFGSTSTTNEITASNGSSNSFFGDAVSVSGGVMVVGAAEANGSRGAAYVFNKTNSGWTQVAELTADDGASHDDFGSSLAIDGNEIVIGASGANNNQGAAYVFTATGSSWDQSAKLTAYDGITDDAFGFSIAISGNDVVIGAPGASSSRGAAYVFEGSGVNWTDVSKLTATTGVEGDSFGESVSIDGDEIAVGAPYVNGSSGAAYIFTNSDSIWNETADLAASNETADTLFGWSVAIHGGFVVVGAFGFNKFQGAAYVFSGSESNWTQSSELTAPDGAPNALFGSAVAIDSSSIVVGAYGFDQYEGAAYQFVDSDTNWTNTAEFIAPNGESHDNLGYAVATGDGTVVIGADGSNASQGAVYVEQTHTNVTGVSPLSGPTSGGTTVTISGTGFTGATEVDFGSNPATDVTIDSDTEITATSPAGSGTVDVSVTSPDGTSPTSQTDQFTYVAAPIVTGVDESQGPTAGGTVVTISGSNFTGATQVEFGATAATSFIVNSDDEITATSPAGSGTVDVSVVTPDGVSPAGAGDSFSYLTGPTVKGISATAGPLNGGTTVTIVGTGFDGATLVDFGATLSTQVVVESPTLITATSPASTGVVAVTVVTGRGVSPVSVADEFRYVAVASVTGLSLTAERTAGGSKISIYGSGFTGATGVNFGAVAAGNFTIVSDNEIVTTVPPDAAATVNVTVINAGGASPTSSVNQFRYVVETQVAEILAPDGLANGGFGDSIAISGDTMVIGQDAATVGSNTRQGVAYVYTKTSLGWTKTAELTASDGGASAFFGDSLAISDNTIVVGAREATIGADVGQGAAYIFSGSGDLWTQTAELTASDGASDDDFGNAVSIDGGTVVVGAPYQNDTSGAAYVYNGSSDGWTQVAKLLAPEGAIANDSDYFGVSVSVSGNTVAVGELGDSINPAGAAYLYTGSGSSWTQAATLLPPSSAGTSSGFGDAVAISGNTVLVGAPIATVGNNTYQGAVYAFTESKSGWSQTGILSALDGQSGGAGSDGSQSEDFGSTVAIDGDTAVVSAPSATVNTIINQGAAYTFTESGFDWTQSSKITAPDGAANDDFGNAVAISGSTYAVGAPGASNGSGKAYVGPWPQASVTTISPASGPADGRTIVTLTGTGFDGATEVEFGVTAAVSFDVVSDTEITATSPPGAAGTVDLTIVTPGGVSAVVTSARFSYVAAPTITRLSVSDGLPTGDTVVTITGTFLKNATAVWFGDLAGTIISDTAAQIVVSSPAESVGVVDLTITAPGGVSANSAADRFAFTPLAVTSPGVAILTTGTLGSFSLTTGADDATFTESGALPNGVSFSASGVFSGTPAHGTVGIYPVVITSTDGKSLTATQALTLMVATPQGAVYWLNASTEGGWLEMRDAATGATVVLDTNVVKLAEDESGSAIALESNGTLVRFAPNSTIRQPLPTTSSVDAGYRDFLVDGVGSVVAFEPMAGTKFGTIVRFEAGSITPEKIVGVFSNLTEDGSGDVVALDNGGNLWQFPAGSTTGRILAANIGSFVVDQAGSVVAYVVTTQSLIRFAAGSTTLQSIPNKYQTYAEDARGDVIALDNSDPTNHLDRLWFLAPGSTTPQQMATNVGTFLVDRAGSVVAFESSLGANLGTLVRFAAGSATVEAVMATSIKQFELDGAGTVVALDANGDLMRFGAGESTPQPMAGGVTGFAVDGAGYVVAEIPFTFAAAVGVYDLAEFAPGSTGGYSFVYNIKDFQLDYDGAVVALDVYGNLQRFSPGSIVGKTLDTNTVQSFGVDGLGEVVALEYGGDLVRFIAGSAGGSYTRTIMYAATAFSSTVTQGVIVKAFHVDPAGDVVAELLHVTKTSDTSYEYGYNAEQLVYFTPGSVQPNLMTFNFVSSWSGDPANPTAHYVNQVIVLVGGEMVVEIGADSQGYFGGQDYEVFAVLPGTYQTTADNPQLYVQNVSVSADNTSAKPNINQSLIQQAQDSQNHHSIFDTILSVFEDVLIVVIGVVITVVTDGAAAPEVAAVVADLGIAGGAVADAIGLACAAAIGDAVTQGLTDAITGKSGFSWTQVLTAGLTAVDGSDLIGDLGDLGDLGSEVDTSDDSLVGQVVEDTLTQAADSFATDLASGDSIDGALSQALQGGLDALTDGVSDELGSALISSTFLDDTSEFLSSVSDVASDLPFANDALSFLNDATSGDWTDLSFSSFANSGISFLNQLVSDNLAGTPFGGFVTSLLDKTVAGGFTADSFTQGGLTFLEDAASDSLSGTDLVQSLGDFLDQVGEVGSPFTDADFSGFLDTSLGNGVGTFLQQAVSGGLTTSSLATGLGEFLQQAVGSEPDLDTSSLAKGLGDFLQQGVGADLSLDTSSLADGLGDILQQALTTNLDLGTSSLALNLGGFLQQAASDGMNFLDSALSTAAGNFLQQEAQAGSDFLNSDVGGNIATFLNEAAQVGDDFANSSLGIDVGTFLNETAQEGVGFLDTDFVQNASSYLDQDLVGSLAGSSLSEAALSYIDQTISEGTTLSNFAEAALPFLNDAVATGFSGATFAQDVAAFVSQLTSTGLTDTGDRLPGVNITNAAILNALGNACLSQGFQTEGTAALKLAEQLAPETPTFDKLVATAVTPGTTSVMISGELAAGTLIPPGNVAIKLDGVTEQASINATTGAFSASFPTSALWRSESPYTISFTFAASAEFAQASSSTLLTVTKTNVKNDFDGNGSSGIGIYQPDTGFFAVSALKPGQYTIGAQFFPRFAGQVDPNAIPITGDFNGDRINDIGLYLPDKDLFEIDMLNSQGQVVREVNITYGYHDKGVYSVPVVGDWSGDGIDGIGVYLPEDNKFALGILNSQLIVEQQIIDPYGYHTGGVDSVPVTGDWSGNGTTGVGIYLPTVDKFALSVLSPGKYAIAQQFVDSYGYHTGGTYSIPVTGDWSGNGTTGVGIYLPAINKFALAVLSSKNYTIAQQFVDSYGYHTGGVDSVPVTGDWSGNGTTGVGIYLPTVDKFALAVLSPGKYVIAQQLVDPYGFHDPGFLAIPLPPSNKVTSGISASEFAGSDSLHATSIHESAVDLVLSGLSLSENVSSSPAKTSPAIAPATSVSTAVLIERALVTQAVITDSPLVSFRGRGDSVARFLRRASRRVHQAPAIPTPAVATAWPRNSRGRWPKS